MDLTISDLKQSIETKCEDTIPFKILFAYEIEEADLPRTEVEASDMTYTSVDFYERQSDKLSLLSRFDQGLKSLGEQGKETVYAGSITAVAMGLL